MTSKIPQAEPEAESVVLEAAELQSFKHQVAGHSPMFSYDASTICKAVNEQEIFIYQTMPDALKPHVPEFKGVVAISLNGSGEDKENQGGESPSKTRLQRLKKISKSEHGHGHTYKFILLENIVEGFVRPSLLDLKLGLKHIALKHPNKTSDSLGVSLCGMQVYQRQTGETTRLTKEDGRHMDESDFSHTVRHFLFDGHDFRRDLIPSLLQQLLELKSAVRQLVGYRFSSSSLLVAYDAEAGGDGGKVVVRLVDFAYTTLEKSVHEDVDRHCLRGLQTVIDIFSSVPSVC